MNSKRTTPLSQRLALILLRLIGWRVEFTPPEARKFVVVVAPHTSNWDLPIGLICGYAMGLLTNWRYGYMAKSSAFRWPLGPVLRWFGGIPIDRAAAHHVVDQMADVFRRTDDLVLAITPEGTRRRAKYWKSGFYHIAMRARVPIMLASLDYGRRVATVGSLMELTGDEEADLDRIRAFFAGVTGKYPHEMGEIRFKRETG